MGSERIHQMTRASAERQLAEFIEAFGIEIIDDCDAKDPCMWPLFFQRLNNWTVVAIAGDKPPREAHVIRMCPSCLATVRDALVRNSAMLTQTIDHAVFTLDDGDEDEDGDGDTKPDAGDE